MKYYIIAGEASGDLHGSNLIRGLIAEDSRAEFRFWGGDCMIDAVKAVPNNSSSLVRHYKEGAVMGLTEVISKANKLLNNISFCKEDIVKWQPDVVILIDYPGFNMRIAKFCHKESIKVFYYIAPKTWASREGRNRKLKEWVDKLFIVFPFEIPYFTSKGIPFIYKGNPLTDAVEAHDFKRVLPEDCKYIALLSGSRKSEISRMMPVLMQTVDMLTSLPEYSAYKFVIAGAPARSEEDYRKYIGNRNNVELVFSRTYDVLRYAEAAIINSGTASLEAALIGTPQVVGWNTSLLTALVAKYILKVTDHIKYISLGNLCLDKLVFKELIQYDLTPKALTEEIRNLIENKAYRNAMLSDYAAIKESLGGEGASRRVAKAMIEELGEKA